MQENDSKNSDEQNDSEKEVHIEPSEPKDSHTEEIGHTPGKAEGADDESATN